MSDVHRIGKHRRRLSTDRRSSFMQTKGFFYPPGLFKLNLITFPIDLEDKLTDLFNKVIFFSVLFKLNPIEFSFDLKDKLTDLFNKGIFYLPGLFLFYLPTFPIDLEDTLTNLFNIGIYFFLPGLFKLNLIEFPIDLEDKLTHLFNK